MRKNRGVISIILTLPSRGIFGSFGGDFFVFLMFFGSFGAIFRRNSMIKRIFLMKEKPADYMKKLYNSKPFSH